MELISLAAGKRELNASKRLKLFARLQHEEVS